MGEYCYYLFRSLQDYFLLDLLQSPVVFTTLEIMAHRPELRYWMRLLGFALRQFVLTYFRSLQDYLSGTGTTHRSWDNA